MLRCQDGLAVRGGLSRSLPCLPVHRKVPQTEAYYGVVCKAFNDHLTTDSKMPKGSNKLGKTKGTNVIWEDFPWSIQTLKNLKGTIAIWKAFPWSIQTLKNLKGTSVIWEVCPCSIRTLKNLKGTNVLLKP